MICLTQIPDYQEADMIVSEFIKFLVLSVFLAIFVSPCQNILEASNDIKEGLFNERIMKLSIEEGMLMVLENNLDITLQRIEPQVEEVRIDSAKGEFDPLISGSFKFEDSTAALSSRSSVAAGGRSVVESETYSMIAGISGKVPLGTEYSIEFEETLTENTFNEFDGEYDSFAGIKVTQPLLKNLGYDTNFFNIHIARKNRDISITELKQIIIDTVVEYKKAYWDLVLAIDNMKVQRESLNLAESLLDLTRKKLIAEVISPLEVTQAEAGVASRKENVIVAKKIVREKENVLKRLISKDVYALRDVKILPTDIPFVVLATPEYEESIQVGFENRPDYQKAKVEIDKKNIGIQYEKNQIFPSIDLEASYGFNGLGNNFVKSLSDLDGNPQWSLGVIAKFPLGNRTARGDLRIAELEASQALFNLKRLEQEILIEIDDAIRDVRTNKERVEAAKVSTRLAEEVLHAEGLKMKAGLSTSHNVLEFQEDLTVAKSKENSAIIDYNKSLVELSRVKGVVLLEENIDLLL
jgi:outer membrane protein TolC